MVSGGDADGAHQIEGDTNGDCDPANAGPNHQQATHMHQQKAGRAQWRDAFLHGFWVRKAAKEQKNAPGFRLRMNSEFFELAPRLYRPAPDVLSRIILGLFVPDKIPVFQRSLEDTLPERKQGRWRQTHLLKQERMLVRFPT